MTAAVITISDKGSRGERIDESGPLLCARLKELGIEVVHTSIIPDEREVIAHELIMSADELSADLVLTTGGTGLALRDITPEATKSVIDREAPGIVEAVRARSYLITPKAMLSRAVAGTRGATLIINMPGSSKACAECMDILSPVLIHAIDLLQGRTEKH